MNEFASCPWYVRHGAVALFFGLYGLGYHSWVVCVVIFVICFCTTMAAQIAMDGWDHNKW